MTRQIRGKIAKRSLQEEPNRQTGRIRRKPQNVEGRTGIQRNILPLKTLPKADGFHDAVQRILRHVFVCPQQSGKAVAVSGLRRFCPVNDGGRSQQTVVILLAQHVIERFTVGKGSVISDRGVQALPLIPPIGFKSEGIEGNQRCAGRLRAYNALDAWMQHGNGVLVACNQTAALYRITLAAGNARLPRCTNFRHILRHCGFARCVRHAENEIAALAQVIEMLLQGRGLRCLFRLPSVKKAENRLRHRAGYAVQQLVMPFGTDEETGFCLLGGVFACTVVRLVGDAK